VEDAVTVLVKSVTVRAYREGSERLPRSSGIPAMTRAQTKSNPQMSVVRFSHDNRATVVQPPFAREIGEAVGNDSRLKPTLATDGSTKCGASSFFQNSKRLAPATPPQPQARVRDSEREVLVFPQKVFYPIHSQ
jgi:hypothetical protein